MLFRRSLANTNGAGITIYVTISNIEHINSDPRTLFTLSRRHTRHTRDSPRKHQHPRIVYLMASSVVDRKFLGKLAREVEQENPLLSSTLFKILGLSNQLSDHLVKARKQRKLEADKTQEAQDLYQHIIWLAREGLIMLESYVLPMVSNSGVLKVLAYKLRASLYHIIVLFHNQPPVSARFVSASETTGQSSGIVDKGKGVARDNDQLENEQSSRRLLDSMEGGPVAPPPGFGPEAPAAFILPSGDYLPTAHRYFKEALTLADRTLWGSHSLRLSIKTEYSAFLYECAHDEDASRKLARKTINEVYEATEGIDNDMFQDACELVTVLGRMMKRGQPSSARSKTSSPATVSAAQQQPEVLEPQKRKEQTAHTRKPVATSASSTQVAAEYPPASQAQPGFI